MNREEFLKTVTLSVVGVACNASAEGGRPRAESLGRKLDSIGVQLYTVRGEMEEDFDGTLARVAEVGYDEVEFAGYFGRSPQAVRTALDASGLAATSTHVSINSLSKGWDSLLEGAVVMGHRYVVVAGIPAVQRQNMDGYRRVAELFNRAGEQARAAGIGFGYHNHAFEFSDIAGQTPYDVMLEACDPELVQWEMDLFWAVRGGADPLDYFRRYLHRFKMVHVKDMDGTPDGDMVDVGKGTIDFAAIFAQQQLAGIEHFYVEHDGPDDPMESIRVSYEFLRQLEF